MSILQAVRGTRDLLPPETELWNHIETTARRVFERYSFGEIRTPIFEDTQLFSRGVGEETDIVSKEMYTFTPEARIQGESTQSLTLRPENTAGVVRAYIEHKLGETGQLQKLYYIGPQFRRERPQKGRYRQFFQIGAEVIGPPSAGSESPLRDAEVLEMLATLLERTGDYGLEAAAQLRRLGHRPAAVRADAARGAGAGGRTHVRGLPAARGDQPSARARLQASGRPAHHRHAAPYLGLARRRLQGTFCRRLHGPRRLRSALRARPSAGARPRLLHPDDIRVRLRRTRRGGLGSQNALLGGGRYDGLSEAIGGPQAPGIGFAMGEDRLVLALEAQARHTPQLAAAYIAPLGERMNAAALVLARELRATGLRVELGDGSFRLKKSFEAANKLARAIVILGEDEVASGILTVKHFATGEQIKVPRAQLGEKLASLLAPPTSN